MAWQVPEDRKYTKTDEWIKVVEGDEALVGITDYAQDQLSDIVYVELPEVGESFSAGDVFGVVESVKAAADLNMPASGEVVAVNTELEDTPEIVNEDPFEKGWMIRVRLSDPSELDALLDAAAYAKQCEEHD
ncbi:MAG TPA: glycine cleavage system protein GcvH [Chloroflexi bacterium]|nr:glycine cleavage system protein GcvH [Chloroflexota bacterium]